MGTRIVLAALLLVAACSTADAGEAGDERPPVRESPATGPVTSLPLVETEPPTTRSPSEPASERSVEDVDEAVATTPEPAVPPVDPPPDPPVAGDSESLAADTEDPSFDLGPDVVLDVDVARAPTDDAGIGEAAPVSGWAGVDRYLSSVLLRPGNTAASVAVSIDGEIVHSAAFGLRDPATGDPAEPQDRFRIASISKPITAITVMALVEDGVIALDEPLGDVVARHVGLGEATGASRDLTFRQLLTHRSGFGKYDGTFFRGGAADCIDAARAGLRSGVGGGGYTYSNMNFCIAGLAIEAVTGLTYEQAVYRFLLTPLGITGMRLAPTFDPGPDEIQHVTTPGRNYMETLGGAGAWVATPSDLVTILDSLDVDTGGFKPLSVDAVFRMLVPPGASLGQRGYGLGIISYGNNRYGHTGTIESTHAMMLNRGDGVIWAITVAGQYPGESTSLERIMNDAFVAGGFVAG